MRRSGKQSSTMFSERSSVRFVARSTNAVCAARPPSTPVIQIAPYGAVELRRSSHLAGDTFDDHGFVRMLGCDHAAGIGADVACLARPPAGAEDERVTNPCSPHRHDVWGSVGPRGRQPESSGSNQALDCPPPRESSRARRLIVGPCHSFCDRLRILLHDCWSSITRDAVGAFRCPREPCLPTSRQ
jgi:hypothetical protein